jgi:glycosyltransferase involved in cell wall biosynthesis
LNPPYRIAHCINSLGLGGAQQIVKYLAAGADDGRFKHVVYAGSGGVFLDELREAGADVRVIERRISKFDPFWVSKLAQAMRRDDIELVHTHLFGDSLHGYLAAQRCDHLPVLMTLHNDTEDFSRIQLAAYRWMLPRCSKGVACSVSAQRSFSELLPAVGNGRIRSIPNGLDEREFAPRDAGRERALRAEFAIPDDALLVGALGRMVEQKGFSYLLEAFALVRAGDAPAANLLMIGDGPQRAALEKQARDLNLAEAVHFTGFRDKAREIIPCLDVLAFSSLYEGLPVTLLEGMAAARCVVATAAPGLRDVIEDDVTGILVTPRDHEALADGLKRALAGRELRERLGTAAARVFSDQYTAARMVEQYEALYTEILAENQK